MQQKVIKFIEAHKLNCGAQVRYMDLVSEVGELGKEIIKGCNYGKQQHANTEETENELGDCLFSLLALCDELNIDAETALNSALDKYAKRFKNKGQISSDN